MNLLVTVQEVQDRMAMGELPGAVSIINSALIAAQLRIESELETKFDLQTQVSDTFYLDPTLYGGVVPNGQYRLRCSNGFIREVPNGAALVVTVADDLDTLDSDPETITVYRVDYKKGILYLPDPLWSPSGYANRRLIALQESYTGRYVRVKYDSGFDVSVIPPDALKEAILAYVPVVIQFSVTQANSGNPPKSYEASGSHALAVLLPLRRQVGFILKPLF